MVIAAVGLLCAPTASGSRDIDHTRAHTMFEEAAPDELLLINGNTWLVPLVAERHRDRLEGVAVFVDSLPVEPHVITLQEVWSRKRVRQVERMFPGYRSFTSERFRTVLGIAFNESGLVTLVRSDLEVSDVVYTLIDRELLVKQNRIVGKGSLATTVSFAGHDYRIVNVHLPNTFGGRFLDNTRASLDVLAIDGVIAGDLNLEPHQLPAGYPVDDVTPTFGNDALGRERVRRIDYVLGDDDTEVESTVVTDLSGRCLPLSDHCFLAARLRPRTTGEAARLALTTIP